MYYASLQIAIGFHNARPLPRVMTRLETEVPEFAPLEARAFDGEICPRMYTPPECVLAAIRRHEWDRIDSLIKRDDVTNVNGESNTWKLECGVCGLSKPFDIMETSDTKFDSESGTYTESSRSVLSKTGAKRRIEEAKAEMDRIAIQVGLADAFGSGRALVEAHRLFNRFHEAGSSAGGRGHKTTVIAALHVASRNAQLPISVAELCKFHSEDPQAKVVNRFIKQARERNLIDLLPPNAEAIVANVLARMNSTNDEVNAKATEMCRNALVNVPPKNQAASAIYLAAKEIGSTSRKYSGVNISKYAFVERRQIYLYARRMQQLFGFEQPKRNPSHEVPAVSAADVKLLRNLRQR